MYILPIRGECSGAKSVKDPTYSMKYPFNKRQIPPNIIFSLAFGGRRNTIIVIRHNTEN